MHRLLVTLGLILLAIFVVVLISAIPSSVDGRDAAQGGTPLYAAPTRSADAS